MAGAGKEGDKLFSEEYGRHHHIVKQMARAEPWVVCDVDIAGLHGGLREVFEKVANGSCHGVHMARRSRHGLGDHMAIDIVNASAEVACFARDGSECRAQQRLRLFLNNGDQSVPHHLGANGIKGGFAHVMRSRMI